MSWFNFLLGIAETKDNLKVHIKTGLQKGIEPGSQSVEVERAVRATTPTYYFNPSIGTQQIHCCVIHQFLLVNYVFRKKIDYYSFSFI